MNAVMGIAILFLIFAVITYPKWSYKEYYKRCEINSKHPAWTPTCGINFFERDPEWFIGNGYSRYVKVVRR